MPSRIESPLSHPIRVPAPACRRLTPARSVVRGANWAPSSEGSEEERGRGKAVTTGFNPFQPLDFFFKPIGELLCPMLMPASHDTLVREYCDELEKDRSSLAQQNVALEKELEKLKLMAAKRQRGKRSKDSTLDRFVDMRLTMGSLPDGGSEEEAAVKAAWVTWEKRDRPLKERIAHKVTLAKLEGGGLGSRSDDGMTGVSGRSGADVAALVALENPTLRAVAVAEWILALLATKQAHPETVTVDEVGPLMGLLYAFPRDERIQAAGAEALALIAMDEGDGACLSAEDLVEEGAITVLKEAMRNHRKNAHLQEQAGSALLHMASRSADVAIEIQQAGGTKAIAAAIKMHPALKYLSAYMTELLGREGD